MAIISNVVLCWMKTIAANIKSEFFFLLPATGAGIFMYCIVFNLQGSRYS